MRAQTQAHPTAANGIADDFDREFREFIGSIAVSPQELAAIVNMPDYSVHEVKEYLRTGGLTHDAPCSPSGRSLQTRSRPGCVAEQSPAAQRAPAHTAAPHRDRVVTRVLRIVPCAAGSAGAPP